MATGSQNSLNQGVPNIEYVTVQCPNAANAGMVDRDVFVQFKRAYKFIMLSNIDVVFQTSGVYLHFSSLGYPTDIGSNQIAPTGKEPWIPLSNPASSNVRVEGAWIKFACPVQQFYIDADHPAGDQSGGYYVTFAGTNDIVDTSVSV
jgi:hypothetical protein